MKLPSRRLSRPNHKMLSTHNLRNKCFGAAGALGFCLAAVGVRAQTLPPTAPTSQSNQVSPAATASPAVDTPLHAEVTYTSGQLHVRADNSSLNQILRSISRVTGLKITGGVEEQRVFGNYGPAPLSTVLATLLDGTGANILLLGGNSGSTPELVLTSRSGGGEFPGPNSPAYAMYDDNNDRSNAVPPAGTRVSSPQVQAPAGAAGGSSGTTPPVSVRAPGQPLTPEMVAQELLQMQAQQDQKKKDLDEEMRRQQVDQNRRLNGTPAQPVSPTPQ